MVEKVLRNISVGNVIGRIQGIVLLGRGIDKEVKK